MTGTCRRRSSSPATRSASRTFLTTVVMLRVSIDAGCGSGHTNCERRGANSPPSRLASLLLLLSPTTPLLLQLRRRKPLRSDRQPDGPRGRDPAEDTVAGYLQPSQGRPHPERDLRESGAEEEAAQGRVSGWRKERPGWGATLERWGPGQEKGGGVMVVAFESEPVRAKVEKWRLG